MALSVEQIKQGVSHEDSLVRDQALRYFTDAWSNDPTVLPLVVESMQSRQWLADLRPSQNLDRLAHTPETLTWFIEKLVKADSAERTNTVLSALLAVVSGADVTLMRPHEERLLQLPDRANFHKTIRERLRLAALGSEELWCEAEAFSQEHKDDNEYRQYDLPQLHRIAEAIGRDATSADRVMSLLKMTVDHVGGGAAPWMELIAVAAAGRMRLTAAAPSLIEKLIADIDDLMNEECGVALSRIGGDAVVDAVSEAYESSWEFRLYGAAALESNRASKAATQALALYERETNRDGEENEVILSALLAAGLNNFASEAIDPARLFLLDGFDEGVRERLVGAAILMGISFPELETWRTQCHREQLRYAREVERLRDLGANYSETEGDFGSLEDESPPGLGSPPHSLPPADFPEDEITLPIRAEKKIGRNDPCPCGSGKKYKKCCGK